MKIWIVVLSVLVTVFAVNADAAVIKFTHESVMSGSINGTSFENASFIITAFGDTNDRFLWFGQTYCIPHQSASIEIEGVGCYDILIPTRTHVNQTFGAVGFGKVNAEDLCDGPIFVDVLYTWDMLSSIGPLSGGDGGMSPWQDIATSGGLLNMVGGSGLLVTFTATLIVGADIDVSPTSHDFGNVQWGHTSTALFTISNVGGGDLHITGLSLPYTPMEFSITSVPTLPVTIAADEHIQLEVTFSPNATQLYTGSLVIISDDPDEASFEIPLSGNGVFFDTPSEQVAYVINFIQKSIFAGDLAGEGPGNSADKRVNALINMIKASGDLLASGQAVQGCQQLADLYLKVDGVSPPPDFVSGEATDELAGAIQEMRMYYGCQ